MAAARHSPGTLLDAVKKKNPAVARVRDLLAIGADPDVRDEYGVTALGHAATHGHMDIVKLLMAAQADFNMRDIFGQTPLMYAVLEEHFEIAILLMQAGAQVNARSETTRLDDPFSIGTALSYALDREDRRTMAEIVNALVSHGADLEILYRHQETALMKAAKDGYGDIVRILLKAGADPEKRNDRGLTALHLTPNLVCARLLKLAHKKHLQNQWDIAAGMPVKNKLAVRPPPKIKVKPR